jgi:hypothetical protein
MMRHTIRFCVILLALFVVASTALAQPGDRVYYYTRSNKTVKEEVKRCQIKEENPKEIVYALGAKTEKLPASEVFDVDHQIPADLNVDIRSKARNKEAGGDKEPDAAKRIKDYEGALAGYRELQEKLGKLEGYRFAQRQLEFKIAQILARLAEAEDDRSRLDDALTALTEFKTKHPNGWQIGMTGKLLARLQIAKGDLKGALATYDEFARRDDLADDVRQEYQLLGIKALLKTDKTDDFAEAERKLTKLAVTLPKGDPQAVRVEIYLAACKAKSDLAGAEKRLYDVITSDADPAIKALAYNTRADCRLDKHPEDAFWDYLMVDQVYNMDREEHAKALYHLSILFDRVKRTPTRAQACRDKLLNEKSFAGLEYQKLAAKKIQKANGDK